MEVDSVPPFPPSYEPVASVLNPGPLTPSEATASRTGSSIQLDHTNSARPNYEPVIFAHNQEQPAKHR